MLEQIQALMQHGRRARHEGRPHDAHRHFAEAVTLSRQTAAPRELIQALKGLGQIERDLGNGDAAQPLYEEAVALCRLEHDALQLAHTVRHLGDIHQDAGRLERAEPCYREALALYRGHRQTASLDLANALRPLAILEERLGHDDSAIALWSEAQSLYEAVNVQEGVDEGAKHLRALRR